MANVSNRMRAYKAPEGYVYDWSEPHTAIIIEEDGTETEIIEHLYAKYLYLGKYDSVDNYTIVPDPKAVE